MAQGTQNNLPLFANQTLGGRWGIPGTNDTALGSPAFAGQCVSYVRKYLVEVLNLPNTRVGDAVNYWNSPYMEQYFDKVTDGSRQDGDILVWGDDPGNFTGPEGHIAIWYNGQLLNQNYGGSLKVTQNPYFLAGYLGSYRLKGEEVSKPSYTDVLNQFRTFQGSDPTEDQMNYYVAREWGVLNGDLLQLNYNRLKALEAAPVTGYTLLNQPVYVKEK